MQTIEEAGTIIGRKIIIWVFLMSVLASCSIIGEEYPFDEEGLTFWGEFNDRGHIRLDGIYFSQDDSTGGVFHIFFENGIFYTSGYDGTPDDILKDTFNIITERDSEQPFLWGAFITPGHDIIKIQQYNTSRTTFQPFKVVEDEEEILNDTTIFRTKPIVERIFKFYKYDAKPDCTSVVSDKLGMP